MHMDRMRVAGQVDEAPDLGAAHHWKKIGLILESRGYSAPTLDLFGLTSTRFDQRQFRFIGPGAFSQLAHRQHRRFSLAAALLLDQSDGAHKAALELLGI